MRLVTGLLTVALTAFAIGDPVAQTLTVPAGGDLQSALNGARPGATILLERGATYVGNFILPAASGSNDDRVVTVRTAGDDAVPPAMRMSPDAAKPLAKLQSPNSSPALATAPGARGWVIQLVEFAANKDGAGDIIQLGDGSTAQTSLAQVPSNLTLDRVYIHGDPAKGQKRAIALNASHVTISNSYISDIKAIGQDSQAIGGWNGPGEARIDSLELGSLKIRNVPVLIKNPPLRDIPVKETESLSPLALGYSMVIDYKTHKLTFGKHLPAEQSDFDLPLRLYRLATVRGTVDAHQANFVVDTGGEVISISQATATALEKPVTGRKIALKVYGTSGWDEDAFLMPGINLAFDAIKYNNFPVVVLNLDAPSALLGFQLGGIVGHKFLSKYRVGIDLERSVLHLKNVS